MIFQQTINKNPEILNILKNPEILDWDYTYPTNDYINPSNQIKRNKKRVEQQKVIEQMYAPAKKRLDRLMNYAKNFFQNNYKRYSLISKEIKIRKIDYRIWKIMDNAGLNGPRADEVRRDYRQKVLDLEKKAANIAASFN